MKVSFDQVVLGVISRALLLPLTFLMGIEAQAQSGSLVGGDSFGAECFRASQVAASTGSADRHDLESCDRAIFDGDLKRKDLIVIYVNRGVIHMAMGNSQQAMTDFHRALEMDGDIGEAYLSRGNLWFFGNNLPNAVAGYDLALELGVEKPHIAHLNRGMAHEQLGLLAQAKSDYQTLLNYVKGWYETKSRLERVKEQISKKQRERK